MNSFYSGSCWECKCPINKIGGSVFLYCSCLALLCQDCARKQISTRKDTYDSYLICPLCNLKSNTETLILDSKKAKDQEIKLLKSCFTFFNLKHPSFKRVKASSFQGVISKLFVLGFDSDINLLEVKDTKILSLKVAQLELKRLKSKSQDNDFTDPLAMISFKSNVLFEKVILGVRGDCSYTIPCKCIVCDEPIAKGRTVLLTCNCSNTLLCLQCVYFMLANQDKTYCDGLKCPTCKKINHVLGNVKEAREREIKLVTEGFKHFQYKSIKTKLNEVQDLHDLYSMYANNGYVGTVDPQSFYKEEAEHLAKQTTASFLRLEIARLELMRQCNTKSEDKMNPHLYLGPLSLLCFMEHKYLDLFLEDIQRPKRWLDEPDSIRMFDEHHKQKDQEVNEVNDELSQEILSLYDIRDLTRPALIDSPLLQGSDYDQPNESHETSSIEDSEEESEEEKMSVDSVNQSVDQLYVSSSSVPSSKVMTMKTIIPVKRAIVTSKAQSIVKEISTNLKQSSVELPKTKATSTATTPNNNNNKKQSLIVSDDESDTNVQPIRSVPNIEQVRTSSSVPLNVNIGATISTKNELRTTSANVDGYVVTWKERDPSIFPPNLAGKLPTQLSQRQQQSKTSSSSVEEPKQSSVRSLSSTYPGFNIEYLEYEDKKRSHTGGEKESFRDHRETNNKKHDNHDSRIRDVETSKSGYNSYRDSAHVSRRRQRSPSYDRHERYNDHSTRYKEDIQYGSRVPRLDNAYIPPRIDRNLFEEGYKVEVCNNGVWYPARVSKVNGNKLYDIAYQDGTTELDVNERFIRLIKENSFVYKNSKETKTAPLSHYMAPNERISLYNVMVSPDSVVNVPSGNDDNQVSKMSRVNKLSAFSTRINSSTIENSPAKLQSTPRQNTATSKAAESPRPLSNAHEHIERTFSVVDKGNYNNSTVYESRISSNERSAHNYENSHKDILRDTQRQFETGNRIEKSIDTLPIGITRKGGGVKEHVLTMGMFYSYPSAIKPAKLEAFTPAVLPQPPLQENNLKVLCKLIDAKRMSEYEYAMIFETPSTSDQIVSAQQFIEYNKIRSYRFNVKIYFEDNVIQRYSQQFAHLFKQDTQGRFCEGVMTSYSPQSTLAMFKNISSLQLGFNGAKINQFLGTNGQLLNLKTTLAENNILSDTIVIIRPRD